MDSSKSISSSNPLDLRFWSESILNFCFVLIKAQDKALKANLSSEFSYFSDFKMVSIIAFVTNNNGLTE